MCDALPWLPGRLTAAHTKKDSDIFVHARFAGVHLQQKE